MNTEKSFAELLLYYRSKAGLSQEELAKKSGVSKVQIAKYETNKSTPRLKAIMKLANALDISEFHLGYMPPIPKKEFSIDDLSSEALLHLDQLAKFYNVTSDQPGYIEIAVAVKALFENPDIKSGKVKLHVPSLKTK